MSEPRFSSKPDTLPRLVRYRPAEGLQDAVDACLFYVSPLSSPVIGVVVYLHGGVICVDPISRNSVGEAGGWWDV
jgi:hypothetical protein